MRCWGTDSPVDAIAMFADPLNATPAMFREVVSVAADPLVFWFQVGTALSTQFVPLPIKRSLFAAVFGYVGVDQIGAALAPDIRILSAVDVAARIVVALAPD